MKSILLLLTSLILFSCGDAAKKKEDALNKKKLELKLAAALFDVKKLELKLDQQTLVVDEVVEETPEQSLERQRREEFYGLVPYLEDPRGFKTSVLVIPYTYENKVFVAPQMTLLDYISYDGGKYFHVSINDVKGLLSLKRIDKRDKQLIAQLRAYIKDVVKLAKEQARQDKIREEKELYEYYASRVSPKTINYKTAVRKSSREKVLYTFRGYYRYTTSLGSHYYKHGNYLTCEIDRSARIPGSTSFQKNDQYRGFGSKKSNENSLKLTIYKGHADVYYLTEKKLSRV
ncbi:MAG: hypothetical protein HRT88_17890 [Lentisphaeraceae bacterium]|nr:hypothetical protein [Lentisphaeraceae bacterium]